MIESNSSTSKSYLALDGNNWPFLTILLYYTRWLIQGDIFALYQDNLTRWRWQVFCWWCLPPRLQGRASSQIGARTRELQPTTCLKYKIMKMQIKNRQSFHEEPEPVEMSSKLTTSGAMNSGVPARFCTWVVSVLESRTMQFVEVCVKLHGVI